jgi:predicted transcriptional regulator
MMPSPGQCRAARALLDVSRDWLARRSGVSKRAISNFEAGKTTPIPNNLAAIRQALEQAGIEFLPEEGVKLRDGQKKGQPR